LIYFNLLSTYSDIVFLAGFFVFVLGASMGSFLNVVVDRLIHGQSLLGRSHCESCNKNLKWNDLIPIASYLILGGKCRHCRKSFSAQYLLVEVGTGLLYVATWVFTLYKRGNMGDLLLYWGIVSSAWVIFISDLRYKLISDYMQGALLFFILLHKMGGRLTLFGLLESVFAGVCVGLPLWLIYKLSKERAMGEGDGILAAIVGFGLGLVPGFVALYFAFVLGGVVGVFLLIGKKYGLKSAVPFGPFLLIGALIVAVFQGEIIRRLSSYI